MKNFIIFQVSITVCLIIAFLGGCASSKRLPLQTEAPPLAVDRGEHFDRIDRLAAETLEDFLPPLEQWPPRENVSPSPVEAEVTCRRIPLSSLAYFPRLSPRLRSALEDEKLESFTIDRYPTRDGETWEISATFDSGSIYRLILAQTIRGRAAVIIDDCGNSLRNRDQLFSFDYPLTLAVLPRLAYSETVDQLAAEQEYQVILHFPLEAINPDLFCGPGGLYRNTARERMVEVISENLSDLPHAVGVNNHMGSAFTVDTESMEVFLEEIKEHNLFFIDSLTINGTVTDSVALRVGIDYLRRDIFLDHRMEEGEIIRQFEKMEKIALDSGKVIAIAHDRPLTVSLLTRLLPTLADAGIQVVPVSAFIKGER